MPLTREALVAHRTATAGKAPHRHVWFFHAHAYFTPEQEAEARAVRDRIGAELVPSGHVQLNGIIGRPVGPHPAGNFEVLFTRDAFADVMTWLQFNRPVWMSVLIHPCTESMALDHSDRLIWFGTPLPIDLKWPRIADEKARTENRDPVDVIDKDKAHRPT
jgi:aromatic ring-cleaving dioxygenase